MSVIEQIIAAKQGDKDFVLASMGGEWHAAIGNRSRCVAIQEAVLYGQKECDFYAEGATADEALAALLAKVLAA